MGAALGAVLRSGSGAQESTGRWSDGSMTRPSGVTMGASVLVSVVVGGWWDGEEEDARLRECGCDSREWWEVGRLWWWDEEEVWETDGLRAS